MKVNHSFKAKRFTQSGFSLVELMVSMSIFTIVLTLAVGVLLVITDASTKARYMQDVMTNLSFAIDSMTREVRTGSGYYCSSSDISTSLPVTSTQDCSEGTTLSIVEDVGQSIVAGINPRVAYRYNATDSSIERRVDYGSGTPQWLSLTSDEVVVSDMYFTVTGSSATDADQAVVTIYIEGDAGTLVGLDTSFDIQTTISRRIIDL